MGEGAAAQAPRAAPSETLRSMSPLRSRSTCPSAWICWAPSRRSRVSPSSPALTAQSSASNSKTAPSSDRAMFCSRSNSRTLEAQLHQAEGNSGKGQGAARAAPARREPQHRACGQGRDPRAQSRECLADPGGSFPGRHRGRPGRDRQSQGADRVLHHPRADQRAHQHGGLEGRQFRPIRPTPAPIATIIQTAPVYVTFSVPQRQPAGAAPLRWPTEPAAIEAIVPGDTAQRQRPGHHDRELRSIRPPGPCRCAPPCPTPTSCCGPARWSPYSSPSARRRRSSVPSLAVQVSQQGSYVFVVKDGVAIVQPVKVARTV